MNAINESIYQSINQSKNICDMKQTNKIEHDANLISLIKNPVRFDCCSTPNLP